MLAVITLVLRHYVVLAMTSDSDTAALAADVMRVVAAFHVRPRRASHARSRTASRARPRACCAAAAFSRWVLMRWLESSHCTMASHVQTGLVLNVVGLYVVGLPVGLALAFAHGMGLLGLWVGLGCGAALQARRWRRR